MMKKRKTRKMRRKSSRCHLPSNLSNRNLLIFSLLPSLCHSYLLQLNSRCSRC